MKNATTASGSEPEAVRGEIQTPGKEYLGDSVYVTFGGWSLVLTTENGYGPTNTIFLEPTVYSALEEYAARAWGRGEE